MNGRKGAEGKAGSGASLYPPNLESISPLNDEDWTVNRGETAMVTSRDVVEAGLFALTRPRHLTIASIVLDADEDGMFG